ncbi:mediator of RNA polymerase II transcription subunit 16-like [Zingiber officinale]|uniref:mediator of RNA polymerase II transcription subunit 16-like n=1 Tax=Zingiber officinale TaxID=94328 RepID=UPI001C4C34B9|nr:mediator of RNA polymerase II transcription subunit 16-like [Zingiber officinale]
MTIPAPTPSPKDASPDSDLTAANDGASREGRAPKGDAVVEAVGGVDKKAEEGDRPMDAGEAPTPALATVFRIRLKQPSSSLRHKKNVPDLCRNFSAVAWCGKLNAIACASETCARIPSSITNPPFWIPIHIVNAERPTECVVFNVKADSPGDSVRFIEWSPRSCRRALLVGNLQGRITIWTQPCQGRVNLVRDASCWLCEYEWKQDHAVATKWLSGMNLYRSLPSNSNTLATMMSTSVEKFLSRQSQASVRWPDFLCVCSVFSSGAVQLHWEQWPSAQNEPAPKWLYTSNGLLGAGPSGLLAADVIITESGVLHVAGVPLVNSSTVVVWEVMPGPGNGFQSSAKLTMGSTIPSSLNPPSWAAFAPLAAYLFSVQEYLISQEKQGKNLADNEIHEVASLHCSPVSNFSAYVSPEAAAQSAATTTWGSGVNAVAFDPTQGGSVITVVIAEGQYMSPYDPDEGPSITGWRVQCWESSLQPVLLHPIFGNPANSGGQPPVQTVWLTRVNMNFPPKDDLVNPHACSSKPTVSDELNSSDRSVDGTSRLIFDPYDVPIDVRQLAQIVYSAHGGEIAVAFHGGGVHIFSGANFDPVDSYHMNVDSTIAAPAFSSTSCCLACVWHDTFKDRTILKIIRVLPPAIASPQTKINSATWERAIANRFWWSLLVGVDWWDAIGCSQSASEDGIVSLDGVIAVLDADFHSLLSVQHRQQLSPNLDRIKCRLLEGTNAQDVRALVLDMQVRLLLDMLGKGIESALVNPATLLPEPWQVTSETSSSIDADKMVVEQDLVPSIQAYVDAILDLASYFIVHLRRYARFCRSLASHGASSGANGARHMVTSPTHSSVSATSEASEQSPFMPININTGAFPGAPAVRLFGDCHFLHRLCQLLFFCLIFWQRQLRHSIGNIQKNPASSLQKVQTISNRKVEENSAVSRSTMGVAKTDEVQAYRSGETLIGPKRVEASTSKSIRYGSGNAGQGYTLEEVKALFLMLVDLCRKTATLQHPLPVSQVGSGNIIIQLHYIDGSYTVLPEVVEASLSSHMQNMPRPRGTDPAGLLLRELELHPPSEDWHKRNMFGCPWSDPDDLGPLDNKDKFNLSESLISSTPNLVERYNDYSGAQFLWPRKRRFSERDAAFGLKTSLGLGPYLGIMGSRRDVIASVWRTGAEGVWYKCIRCLRQTCAFAQPHNSNSPNEREAWWIGRWVHGCPMCGGAWVRVV